MNKTTRRSKGFGFVEFSTEEEANTALKEMNGKVQRCLCLLLKVILTYFSVYVFFEIVCEWKYVQILNGWLISVDIAKPTPRSGRAREMPQKTPDMNKEVTAEAVEDLRNP
jgi:RNA recognition motif-containing protein